jgi:nicotinamidase-related amidase
MSTPLLRLRRENAVLAVIDFQEKLAAAIDDREATENNIERLIRGCHLLGIPALYTEQYPQGIGETTPRLRRAFGETYGTKAVQKMCFSGYGCPEFVDELERLGVGRQVLLAGSRLTSASIRPPWTFCAPATRCRW